MVHWCDTDARWIAEAEKRYARVFEHEARLSPQSRLEANEALLRSYEIHPRHTSVARSVRGLADRFASELHIALPDDVRAVFEDPR